MDSKQAKWNAKYEAAAARTPGYAEAVARSNAATKAYAAANPTRLLSDKVAAARATDDGWGDASGPRQEGRHEADRHPCE